MRKRKASDLSLPARVRCIVDTVENDLMGGALGSQNGLSVDGHVFHHEGIQRAGNVGIEDLIFTVHDGFRTDGNGLAERESLFVDGDTDIFKLQKSDIGADLPCAEATRDGIVLPIALHAVVTGDHCHIMKRTIHGMGSLCTAEYTML